MEGNFAVESPGYAENVALEIGLPKEIILDKWRENSVLLNLLVLVVNPPLTRLAEAAPAESQRQAGVLPFCRRVVDELRLKVKWLPPERHFQKEKIVENSEARSVASGQHTGPDRCEHCK